MLVELEVKQFALLHSVRIEPGPGLNVFTGETGAGKSLLIDALEFLLGHTGISGGEVLGIFKPPQELLGSLPQEGFEFEDEGFLYISRNSRHGENGSQGKTISRINGTYVPSSKVKSLAGRLLEIHAQHAYHSLFDPRAHLLILDTFGGAEMMELRDSVSEKVKTYKELEKRVRELSEMESRRERELDLCRYELDEIEKAGLVEGEEESLHDEKEKLSQAAKLQSIFAELSDWVDRVPWQKIESHMEKISPHEKKLGPWLDRLREIGFEWDEFRETLKKCDETFLPDPDRLETVLERLDFIQRLKKKYGQSISEVLSYAASRKETLSSLESVEDDLAASRKKLGDLSGELEALCASLSGNRKRLSERLKKEVEKEFAVLALPHGKFEVSIEHLNEWGASGMDKVEFLVSLNPGEPYLPLKDAASGGELSRIMLALRTIGAASRVPGECTPLVFDEVDAGLGGEAAFHVAERLRALASSRQVFCVTHLHQVASAADHHFSVEKEVVEGRTFATVKPLDDEEKVRELARMMGGTRATESLMQHARELLASSRKRSNISNHSSP